MKGLIIKDFKLLMMQKSFFITLAIVAIFFGITTDSIFVIGFLTMICSMFSLSTISYDEFDNGNAFLFSLPITRKGYVIEKYIFGIMLGVISLILSTIIACILTLFLNSTVTNDLFLVALIYIPIVLVLQSLMLPLQIKFGSEKSRVAMFIVFAIIFIIGYGFNELIRILNIDFTPFINTLLTMNVSMILVIVMILSLIIMFISCKISMKIIKNKEF